jgi:hypothetical protein
MRGLLVPLRDHFRSPLDDVHSWDELHGGWPAVLVQQLIDVLPEPYIAAPRVHLGTLDEIKAASVHAPFAVARGQSTGAHGAIVTAGVGSQLTRTLEPQVPNQDVYEVRIYDSRRNRQLVAAIEIVSPSNKDRPETRGTFVSKVAALLKHDICVSIVDVVTLSDFNLYAELMNLLDSADPALGDEPPPIYAVTVRMRYDGHRRLMDNWYHPLAIGQPLPTLPIWLKETWAISLDLETSYEETCRTLRIR